MVRGIILIVMLVISGIIFIVKFTAKKITGGDSVSFQEETKKVMNKTAKGVNWMNEQWEDAKKNNKGIQ